MQCQFIDVIVSFTIFLIAQLSNRSSNLYAHNRASMESSFTLFSMVSNIGSLLAMTKVGLWLPPSYRGCWHEVSRGFLFEACHNRTFDERTLQAALPFFTHAILSDQAFAHCPRFPTTASRRSLGRVSVPVWLIIQKDSNCHGVLQVILVVHHLQLVVVS